MATNDKPVNWAGNFSYNAARWHRPASLDELQSLVAHCETAKVLGTRHSFNSVADTTGDSFSLARFDKIVALDREKHTVTIEAGVGYSALCPLLEAEGFALHNLASLPHISVAGACATATHGSGAKNGNLATAVTAIEMVTASGDIVALSREGDGARFDGVVVALGALGVVTKLTLKIEPTYEIWQNVYENLPFAEFETHFEEMSASAYSLSFFTHWRGEHFDQVWLKRRTTDAMQEAGETNWFGATPADGPRHPIASVSAEHCTTQEGIPGPWHERLPHFRSDFTPSSGEELQSEYFVARVLAPDALRAVSSLRERLAPLVLVSEIRLVAADALWLSPCYQQDCVAFHFTWKPDWPAVRELLPLIEAALAPFGVRPHWGKLFTMNRAELQPLYENLPDFQQLLRDYDPEGKFRNGFLEASVL